MYYVCVEDNRVVSVLNYAPACPPSVQCVAITDDEYSLINANTHYFDLTTNSVVKLAESQQASVDRAEKSADSLRFLNSTDWQVLRHIRQTALGLETSLTHDEYIELEKQRQLAANAVER